MFDLSKREEVHMTDIVNSTLFSPRTAAEQCSKDHRYLQEQLFIFCMHYLDELSESFHNRRYDARNEFSCSSAAKIVDAIFDKTDLTEIKYTTMLKKSLQRKNELKANGTTD